jgi:hypothetical protein
MLPGQEGFLMNLEQAIKQIQETANAMSIAYKGTIFDEMAIVTGSARKLRLVWYQGPRQEDFIRSFNRDTAALRAEIRSRMSGSQAYEVGDFQFVQEGVGTQAEVFVRLSQDAFLICGNTTLSMADIGKSPRWLAAQKPFAVMCDRFRMSPIDLEDAPLGPQLGAF